MEHQYLMMSYEWLKIKKIKNMKYKHLLLSDDGVGISINKSFGGQFRLSEIELNKQALQWIYSMFTAMSVGAESDQGISKWSLMKLFHTSVWIFSSLENVLFI